MKVFSAVVCALLLAGANGDGDAPREVTRDAGSYYAFTVTAVGQTIAKCNLITPDGVLLDFTPGAASQHGDRYVLQPIHVAMPACSVLVSDLKHSDSGTWEISFVNTAGTGDSQSFQLVVTGAESQDSLESEETDEVEDIEWLTFIHFPTRTDQIIDISLPRNDHEEECFVRTPNKQFIEASKVDIDGVEVHKSSYFVSCRITIGPMVESLRGEWVVCGKYTENEERKMRCQLVKVYWNDEDHPERDWHTNVQTKFDHPVHFDSTLTPAVIGNGDVVTCHVITPDGEDLVIGQNSKYPSIEVTYAHSICSFTIGPLHRNLLGDWVIYGVFRNSIQGLNEERLPFSMFLYDEEDPYKQAYNVTVLDPVTRAVNLGNTLNMEVSVNTGQVDGCYFEPPSKGVYKMGYTDYKGASFVEANDGSVVCRVAVGPITEELIGYWKIIGKFSNNGIFTERQQTFHLVQEDPENPIQEDRQIIYLTAKNLNLEMWHSERLVIPSHDLVNGESCHIRTPNDLQYQIMKGFTLIHGVEVIEEDGVECGVIVTAVSEDVGGEWTLMARATQHSTPIERRLPFTIYVTGESEVEQTTEPEIEQTTEPEIEKTTQPEVVDITAPPASTSTLSVVRDRSVEQDVGPVNAVYCRLEDPQGLAVFDDFGRCHLSLNKVRLDHRGNWKMLVAVPGKILTEEHLLIVDVSESEGKAAVTTHVAQDKPIVTVTCSVQTEATITGCKFRNPQGKILISASGLAEDRYDFYGKGASIENGVRSHECGIRITDPETTDLGLWRCAIETAEETYYGHMAVLCPWALSNPAVAAVVQQEPILKAIRSTVNVVDELPTTMSCSVESVIRYCYFRAANGTTFTVTPGMSSSSMEYVGAGFDAGECGIRFNGMYSRDSGRWSCHVGLVNDTEEQRDQFQVTVHERMQVRHFTGHGNVMTVEGIVYEGRALEYCRFVRMDGFGFTTENVPSQYRLTGIIANGECQFTASEPTILDLHPWTIVARIRGQDVEIARDTMESIIIGPPETERPPVGPEDDPGIIIITYRNNAFFLFLYMFLSLLVVFIIVGALLGPKRNREKASAFRRSISNSFRRQPRVPAPSYTP